MDPELAAIHREGYLRFRQEVEQMLGAYLSFASVSCASDKCRSLSIAINGLIDGLWLEACLANDLFEPCSNRHQFNRKIDRAAPRFPRNPYDSNSIFLQGPRFAPAQIREALRSDHWNMPTENGTNLEAFNWQDLGDIAVSGMKTEDAYRLIEKSVGDFLDNGTSIVSLGGDHSVSFPVIMAHAERNTGLNILHIDAYPDLYDSLQDNQFSHASPFARLMETGRIKRLVQVGIRTLNAHQQQQAERFGVEILSMDEWSLAVDLEFNGPVYLSLDLDALDPAFAPGVSHREPGGLTTRDVVSIIKKFKGQLIGADVVELSPPRI